MERGWQDFKALHSNTEGARAAFEDACERLFKKKYANEHVSKIRVKKGDGGVDIYVGELGVEPIIVIQCKFFLDSFGNSQKNQIRESYKTAVKSEKFNVKEWILCIPREIDIDETSWWFKWKTKQPESKLKGKSFIKLLNGTSLISEMKDHEIYNEIFKIDDLNMIKEIHAATTGKKKLEEIPKKHKNRVLFISYKKDNEDYYLERDIDISFQKYLEISNIWVFGKSGSGKTNLVNRNLIDKNKKYFFCDLSPVDINSANDVLEEIVNIIEQKTNCENRHKDEKNLLKKITLLLCENNFFQTVVFIDELSADSNEHMAEISNKLLKLVVYFNNYNQKNELRFIISTIQKPNDLIKNQGKAIEHFKYISCDSWGLYMECLFNLISCSLNIKIPEHRDLIIEHSKNSPRNMKYIFRDILVDSDSKNLCIKETVEKSALEIVSHG